MKRQTNEGNVYNCSWKKRGGRFLVWVESHKDWQVDVADFDDAEDRLCELICDKTGDPEAVLDFDPLPPVVNRTNWTPIEIVSLDYNASADLVDREQPLFSKGRCVVCRTPRGDRTTAPIQLKNIPHGDSFSVRNFRPFIQIFSESFVSLLTSQERAVLRFQPVKIEGKSRKKFYELTGKTQIHFVGIKDATYNPICSFRCPLCDTRSFLMQGPDIPMYSEIQNFVAVRDLPSPLPSVLLVGKNDDGVKLCMPRHRWLEIRGKPGTKRIPTSKIGIVPAKRVDRNPILPIPKEWQVKFKKFKK
jgi:hypothetical protein